MFVKDLYEGFVSCINEVVHTHLIVWSHESAGLLWMCACVSAVTQVCVHEI